MEEVAAVRRVAREAVADVEPDRLREGLTGHVDDGSVVPGVLTVLAGRGDDASASGDGLLERAAGVQLIYDGLRLTRRLAHEEPWLEGGDAADGADLSVLVADVLVARGFYLLARTAAAGRAVEVVREFGRDQTLREADPELNANLERDVVDLALVAGAAPTDGKVPPGLEALATEAAADVEDGFPDAAVLFSGRAAEFAPGVDSADGAAPADATPANRNS